MWQELATELQPEFHDTMHELMRSTSRTLILSIGAMYLAWHAIATVSWPIVWGWQVWSVTVVVVGISALALFLLPKNLPLAHSVWLAGIAAATTLALLLFQQLEIVFLFALLPLAAVVLLGRLGGLLVEGGVVVLLGVMAASGLVPLPPGLLLVVAIGGAVTWLLGWASTHSLATAVQWSLFSFTRAQQHLEATQSQRGQLARTLKDLDHAYYRLDRANAALVAARKTAEEAERFKAEFVANISHELRTPLNLIVGFSEVMMTAPQSYNSIPLPGPYRRDLNAIYRSAQHLLALVDDVLDLARIEAGKIALAREHVDLAELIAEAVVAMRDYISAKGLELQVDVPDGLPALWLDRVRIRQVLLNLVVNATRFTERGGISVAVVQQDGEIVVRVRDTGRGISEHDLATIFEAFRAADEPTSTWHSGTGLGLPISKQFVELHHGRMGVESVIGQGTTFWFTLPYALPPSLQTAARASRWTPQVALGASERVVVVAHDDPQVATLLRRHLDGYQIVSVADLAEGVGVAAEVQAVALVTDTQQSAPTEASTALVIRCPLPSNRQTARGLGAANLLVKPVAHQTLLAALDALEQPVRRLLIAEDDPDLVRLFQRILSTRAPAPECLVAHNGLEALDILRNEQVDLVLLDLDMPEMNGRGVLDQLASAPQLADTRVLIITGQEQDYARLRLSGAVQIVRPEGFQLGELIQLLDAVLRSLSPGWSQVETTLPTPTAAPPG